jgi:hypothetical protein
MGRCFFVFWLLWWIGLSVLSFVAAAVCGFRGVGVVFFVVGVCCLFAAVEWMVKGNA